MKSPWTAERVATLTRLWNENLRTALIAAELGMGRNQVIGKAHRLGLQRRPSPIKGRIMQGTKGPQHPRPEREAILHSDGCQYIAGEPGTGFCGKPGSPWCPKHRAIVFTRVKLEKAA